MNDVAHADSPNKYVQPPLNNTDGAPSVIGIKLAKGEEVRWIWTHYPDGRSLVTGYEIVMAEDGVAGFDFKQAVKNWLWPQP